MKFSKKFGLASLAVLLCIAERGKFLLGEMFSARRDSLKKSLLKIDSMKDIRDYYDALQNITENNFRTIVSRLKSRGLVRQESNFYSPTSTGLIFLKKLKEFKEMKWDGKWRMVFFDIPEVKRSQRFWLNGRLKRMNYKYLQKSVYIGKYPLDEEFIAELLERKLYQFVRIITVGTIDDDKFLEF